MIFSFGIVVSVLALIVAFESYRKERGYWREDEAMMTRWLKERNKRIESLEKKLLDTNLAHREIMSVVNKTYVKMKRQISNRDGQITKLKKLID